MKNEFDLLTALTAVGVASYIAIMLACVARNDFGWSDGQIRMAAVAAAVLVAVGLAADSFGRRPGKAR